MLREKFGNDKIQEPLTCVEVNVVENKRVGSLITVKRYVGSDDVQHTVDMRNLIARTKPDLLS